MSKVDWSLAPEGATHWDASTYRVNSFMKLDGGMWFYWPPESPYPSWHRWGKSGNQNVSDMIERPNPQSWSGEKDGLPPVGLVCELKESVLLADEYFANWFEAGTQVEVGGHVKFREAEGPVCAICVVGDNFTGTLSASYLRPVKTPEQLAAEERENAVHVMVDSLKRWNNVHELCGMLYDAGFKREVK